MRNLDRHSFKNQS